MWLAQVVFTNIYRSLSVLYFTREFWQTLAADLSVQMVRVIVWRCEVTHAELPRRFAVTAVLFTQRWLMSCRVPSRHQRHALHLLPGHTFILHLLLSSILSSVCLFVCPRSLFVMYVNADCNDRLRTSESTPGGWIKDGPKGLFRKYCSKHWAPFLICN